MTSAPRHNNAPLREPPYLIDLPADNRKEDECSYCGYIDEWRCNDECEDHPEPHVGDQQLPKRRAPQCLVPRRTVDPCLASRLRRPVETFVSDRRVSGCVRRDRDHLGVGAHVGRDPGQPVLVELVAGHAVGEVVGGWLTLCLG